MITETHVSFFTSLNMKFTSTTSQRSTYVFTGSWTLKLLRISWTLVSPDAPQVVLKDLKKERDESFDIESGRKLPPVNENEEFCSVFRTRLGHHSMVYGAEMDGFRMKTPSEGPLNPDDIDLNQDGHFIELKTNRIIDSPRLESRYKNPRNFLFGFRSTTIRSENQNSKQQTFLTVKILLLNEEPNWGT